jgi:hypothetical protein
LSPEIGDITETIEGGACVARCEGSFKYLETLAVDVAASSAFVMANVPLLLLSHGEFHSGRFLLFPEGLDSLPETLTGHAALPKSPSIDLVTSN